MNGNFQTISERISFIRQTFGEIFIARDGINVATACPSCGRSDSTGKKKFSINVETWQFHCWVCDVKGKNLFNILKKYGFRDAAEIFGNKFQGKYLDIDAKDTEKKLFLPKDFLFLADNMHSLDPDTRACLSYIRSRGLSDRDLWYFRLGTTKSGSYRRRVIIPSFDHDGELNFFVARAVDKSQRIKYLNSKVDKRKIVFNELNIDWSRELTIVEGPFDLIKCNDNTACLLGSGLSTESLLFKRIISNKTPVILALDSDMVKKTQKYAKALSLYDCEIKILDLGDYSDVGEMSKNEFLKRKNESVVWTRSDFLIQKIRSIQTGSII